MEAKMAFGLVADGDIRDFLPIAGGIGVRNLLWAVGFRTCQRHELGDYHYDFCRLFGHIQHYRFLYFCCSSGLFDECGRFYGSQRRNFTLANYV